MFTASPQVGMNSIGVIGDGYIEITYRTQEYKHTGNQGFSHQTQRFQMIYLNHSYNANLSLLKAIHNYSHFT